MKFIKKLLKPYSYILISLIILTLIVTVLSYFNILGPKLTNVFKLIVPTVSLFIGGFMIGKNSDKEGWLEGLKLGGIFAIILLLLNFTLLKESLKLINILYYGGLVIASSFGGMVGVNKKKN